MVMSNVGILSTKMRNTTIAMSRSQRPRVLHFPGHCPPVAVALPTSPMLNRLSEIQPQLEKTAVSCCNGMYYMTGKC